MEPQEKYSGYYCWILRKKKVKHEILFRNYSSRFARALSIIVGRKCLWENDQELASQTYLQVLVPYLNNASEETTFGSNQIKKQHETMKLQYEVHLKPWLLMNWNGSSQCIYKWETFQKKAICIYSTLILTKSKYFVSYMIKLPC